MIEHILPFPSICQKAAVTHWFSIFADIFFIKQICLWSKDAYSHFLQHIADHAAQREKMDIAFLDIIYFLTCSILFFALWDS